MRPFLLSIVAALMVTPALAQPPACEASASSDIGEVIAQKDGGPVTLVWVPERRDDVGERSDYFGRPALMMDFRAGSDGDLLGPVGAIVSFTRLPDSKTRKVRPLTDIRVRAKPKGGATLTWEASEAAKGEAGLATSLKDKWPSELVIDLIDKQGKLQASAAFDLSTLPEANKLAHEAQVKLAKKCS
jgi:hypothetical protein